MLTACNNDRHIIIIALYMECIIIIIFVKHKNIRIYQTNKRNIKYIGKCVNATNKSVNNELIYTAFH